MGFRFRRRVRLTPGVHINLNKELPSVSVGTRGATVNLGKRGLRGTVGLPGTGLSYSAKFGGQTDALVYLPPGERYIHNVTYIGFAALYLRDFDEMVSLIEYIYVTGVPSGLSRGYSEALEQRGEADRLCEGALVERDLARQQDMAERAHLLGARAFFALARIEAELFPGQPVRTISEDELAQAAREARALVLHPPSPASTNAFVRFTLSRAFVPVAVGVVILLFIVGDLLFGH